MHFAFVLGLITSVCALAQLDEAFEFIKTYRNELVPGACSDDYIEMLRGQWPQMQDAVWTAWELSKSRPTTGLSSRIRQAVPEAVGSALRDMLAIPEQSLDRGTNPFSVEERITFGKMRSNDVSRFSLFFEFLATPYVETEITGSSSKPGLLCDSTFMEWVGPEDSKLSNAAADSWIFSMPSFAIRGPSHHAYMAIPKKPGEDEPPRNGDKPPTPCARPDIHTITLSRQKSLKLSMNRRIIVLCPSFFTRGELGEDGKVEKPYENVLQTVEEGLITYNPEDNASLSKVQPKWVLFLEQIMMMHSKNLRFVKAKHISEDLKTGPRPLQKSQFTESPQEARNPAQCLNLALYDLASELHTSANSLSNHNAPSFAWYTLIVYLWYRTRNNDNWATGYPVTMPPDQWIPSTPRMPQIWPLEPGIQLIDEEAPSKLAAQGETRKDGQDEQAPSQFAEQGRTREDGPDESMPDAEPCPREEQSPDFLPEWSSRDGTQPVRRPYGGSPQDVTPADDPSPYGEPSFLAPYLYPEPRPFYDPLDQEMQSDGYDPNDELYRLTPPREDPPEKRDTRNIASKSAYSTATPEQWAPPVAAEKPKTRPRTKKPRPNTLGTDAKRKRAVKSRLTRPLSRSSITKKKQALKPRLTRPPSRNSDAKKKPANKPRLTRALSRSSHTKKKPSIEPRLTRDHVSGSEVKKKRAVRPKLRPSRSPSRDANTRGMVNPRPKPPLSPTGKKASL